MRTPAEAIAWEQVLERSKTTEYDQHCQKLARTAYDLPPNGTDDAIEGWATAKFKGEGVPVEGALMYWTRPPHGHVVICDGKGNGLGNYWPENGRVRTLPLAEWNRVQGGNPAGWARDIVGHLVVPDPTPAKPTKTPNPLVPFLVINLNGQHNRLGRYEGPIALAMKLCGVSANTKGATRIQRYLKHPTTGALTRDELAWLAHRFDLDTKES